MSLTACFADIDQVVLAIADDTDCRAALDRDHSHLAGRKTQRSVLSFLRHELRAVAGCADHLSALARMHLNVVYHSTDRNAGEREAVPDFYFSLSAVLDRCTDREASA